MPKAVSLIGEVVGEYKLIEYLGEGRMTRVYKGRHEILNRYVAVKVLHDPRLMEPEFIIRFKDQSRFLMSLRHPNIVQIYDYGVIKGRPYFVMEYVPGTLLKDEIEKASKSKEFISINQSFRVIYSLALALDFGHKRNLTHGNVNPKKILVEDSDRIVLTDFGLANLIASVTRPLAPISNLEGNSNNSVGRNTRTSKPRDDIFALGMVYYETLTGKPPFENSNGSVSGDLKIANRYIPPSELVPDLSTDIEKIVTKALKLDSEERYLTVNEFIRDLTKARMKTKTSKLPTAQLVHSANPDLDSNWIPEGKKEPEGGVRICLNIVETGQILDLKEDREYIIGRMHKSQALVPDIDLAPFNAHEWGVSRLHAAVTVNGENVFVRDMESFNGTWLGSERLPENKDVPLAHGDIFHLGKLKVQVLIYK